MPQYLNDLRNELITVIGAAWPDVVDNGIYRGRELVTMDWDRKVEAGELPCAVLDLDAAPSGGWGLGNRVDGITARIYRVVADSETPDELIEELESLRTALWPAGGGEALTEGQVLEYPAVTDTMETPVNRYFLATLRPCYSGCVVVQILAGESA